MPPFNLVDEPWIPCVDLQGRPCELGLRDVLLRAPELREIYDDSPPITIALHRLLLAVAHCCWQHDSEEERYDEWEEQWRRRSFDEDVVTRYLNDNKLCFDLFSEVNPFYQIPKLRVEGVTEETASSIVGLELRQKNNPTLFDHNTEMDPPRYTPAKAARALLMGQSYAMSGLGSRNAYIGEQPVITPKNFEQGNLTKGAVVWLSGANVFQTLALNLVPHKRRPNDKPIWERSVGEQIALATSFRPRIVAAKGVLDRLTWQSRMIRLLPEEEEGRVFVRRALVAQGRSSSEVNPAEEEMQAFLRFKERGFIPLSLSATKSAWRDSHSLLSLGNDHKRPTAFNFVAQHAPSYKGEESLLAHEEICRINVAGIVTDQAKILLWRHDRMPAPTSILRDVDLVAAIGYANEDAEFVARSMLDISRSFGKVRRGTGRMWEVCQFFFYPPEENDSLGNKSIDREKIAQLAEHFDPRRAFWPRMETHFYRFLLQLPENRAGALETWSNAVQYEAKRAFNEATRALGTSPRAVRATAHLTNEFLTQSRLKTRQGAQNLRKEVEA